MKSVKTFSAYISSHLRLFKLFCFELEFRHFPFFFNAKLLSDSLSTYSVEIIELICTLLEVVIDVNKKVERSCASGFVSSFIH